MILTGKSSDRLCRGDISSRNWLPPFRRYWQPTLTCHLFPNCVDIDIQPPGIFPVPSWPFFYYETINTCYPPITAIAGPPDLG